MKQTCEATIRLVPYNALQSTTTCDAAQVLTYFAVSAPIAAQHHGFTEETGWDCIKQEHSPSHQPSVMLQRTDNLWQNFL